MNLLLKEMLLMLLSSVLGLGTCLAVGGCMVDGERTITVEFFGQTIKVHDRAHINHEGRMEYRVGTVAEDALVKKYFASDAVTGEPIEEPPLVESPPE